ncbi:unnamed protein product [Mucor hiemalis]
MRKVGNRPISVPKKNKDNENKNYSAARNSSARRNPIAVPFDPPSNGPTKIVAKMKSSLESTSPGISSSSSSSHRVEEGRRKRQSERNTPKRQSSRSLTNKRKEEEIIEIDSDQEDNCDSGEKTPKPTLRKRRLIQPDNDSDDENEILRPSSTTTATTTTTSARKIEVNDDIKKRVANKLKNDRAARQDLIDQHERQIEKYTKLALERDYEKTWQVNHHLFEDKETFEREKEHAIRREREREEERLRRETNLLKSRLLYEHRLNTSSSSSFTEKPSNFITKLDIPAKRTEPTLSPTVRSLATSISKSTSPLIDKPIIQDTSKKMENFFNLPAIMKSARDKLTKKIYQQPYSYKESDIKSKPVIGDIFEFEDDDFKRDSTTTTNTTTTTKTTTSSSSSKKKSVEEPPPPPLKIELPYDPIDDDPLKPIGSDKHLLTYPFEGKKSVTVYERDLTRLDEDQYLNDTLLDVFPKIWDDDYPTSKLIHTFSSFFYTKLAGDGNSVNYDKIGRWTANINIFEKSMIIIPVAQNYHWYLIVVSNPSRCIRNAELYGLVDNIKDADIDVNYIEEDRPPRVGRWKNQVPAGAKLNPKKSYIMLLDSLGGMKKETCTNISEYLKQEAMVKLNIQEDDFIEPEFVSAHCPTQKNFVDCGVFCLHYMRSLYQDPRRMMTVLYVRTTSHYLY